MTESKPERLANSDLARACSRCGRRFPRLYLQDEQVVCKVGPLCRPARRASEA